MSDYIIREDAIMVAGDMLNNLTDMTCKEGEEKAREYFRSIPATDVVAVVRCKDCKFYYNGRTQCLIHDSTGYRPDDFCSYGERKDEGL